TGQPLPLTRKNLARLNTLNGDSKRKEDSAYFESETMPISTTASEFQQQAYENGILDPTASRPPHDLDALRRHLTKRRRSIPPSGLAHQQFCEEISYSYNEAEASDIMRTEIMVNYRHLDQRYSRSISRTITQIPQRDFNRNLSPPQPDLMEGLKASFLSPGLRTYALHSDRSLALCHFATEFKRTDGNLAQAVYQAAYDGAVLVYARNHALAGARAKALEGTRDHAAAALVAAIDRAAGETAVLTCATDGTIVEVFAHYFERGKYHQCRVANESLLAYPNRGRELLRNAQDYARRKSHEL
ncbi:hypothetical protein B0T25DRAFT_441946, partial [Lasiosphaeria hispida]